MCRKDVNMVQSFDYGSFNKPNYNAVKINIKNPEVNAGNNNNVNFSDTNGNYSAVNIEIDNPTVNTEPKRIYDYPYVQEPVTYDMITPNKIALPTGFPVTYHTTNVILPKIENEIEIEEGESEGEAEEAGSAEDEEQNTLTSETEPNLPEKEEIPAEAPAVPEPNYTTTDAEKGLNNNIQPEKESNENKLPKEENINPVKINNEIKRPEIIPGEEILPDVDIPLVIANLTNEDYDVQAQQMEEIARISLDNPGNAIPYIVRDVFSSLIDIAQKDTTNLAVPTEQQVDARKKLIANFMVIENASKQNQTEPKLPYKLTEADFTLANELSPMEMAERNKEYALYTIAILSKIYTDEVQKQTGNIVPLTDLPGSAIIVDALRYSPNAGVKIAAIDALRHIQRPEYDEELNTLYTLAQADPNPQVSISASRALSHTNVSNT